MPLCGYQGFYLPEECNISRVVISNKVKLCNIKYLFYSLQRSCEAFVCVCVHIGTSVESLGARLDMKIEPIVT